MKTEKELTDFEHMQRIFKNFNMLAEIQNKEISKIRVKGESELIFFFNLDGSMDNIAIAGYATITPTKGANQ